MELTQLEYFVTLAKVGNFTKAAGEVTLSQPALSRSILNLEKELGAPLFDRIGKKIRLTKYGEVFLEYATRALNEVQQGRNEILHMLDPNYGCISLGFLYSLDINITPRLVNEFKKLYPNVQFELYQSNLADLKNKLSQGEIDLCIAPRFAGDIYLEWHFLFEEILYIAVSKKHRFADFKQIKLSDTLDEPFITYKSHHRFRAITDELFSKIDATPKFSFEGEEIMTIAGLVNANLGISLIPKTAPLELLDIVFVPVSYPKCTRRLGVSWNINKNLSPIVETFKDFIIEMLAEEAAV